MFAFSKVSVQYTPRLLKLNDDYGMCNFEIVCKITATKLFVEVANTSYWYEHARTYRF